MNIEELYEIYNTLSSAGDEIGQYSKEYAAAIDATRLGTAEKKLSTQIIQKYFAAFPSQQKNALDAIFDLCESDDKNIQIAAMKALPYFCKDASLIAKISDVMGQMLQLDDAAAQTSATNAFIEILKKDPKTVITSVFKTIHNPEMEDLVRFRCIQFILSKIKVLDPSLVTPEIQDLMITKVKMTLNSCIADEFVLLMKYLVSTNVVKTFAGQKEISDIVMSQIQIEQDFRPFQPKCNFTDRLVCCVKFILPFFSAKVESKDLVMYYCDKVLLHWDGIGYLNDGVQYQTVIAQQLAMMAPYSGVLENPQQQVAAIYDVLLLNMPEVPEDTSSNEMPELNFSIVEALLFAFHALARQCPEFLNDDQARLQNFRARLLYFSRGVHGCLKVLNTSPAEKIFSPDDKRIREMSPKLLTNINTLVKDLFYKPPVYKCKVVLSFTKKEEETKTTKTGAVEKRPAAEAVSPQPNKRHVPIKFDSSSNGASHNNQPKRIGGGGDKKIYQPPRDKFSHKIHGGRGSGGGGSMGGRVGGYRGRVRGRGGYRGGHNRN